MNTISKVLTLLISAVLFITTTAGVSAQSDDQLEFEELYEKYDIVSLSEVPEGIQPIVINSPEELEKLLQSIGKQNNIIERDLFLPDDASLLSQQTTVQRHCTAAANIATFNTWADINVKFDPGTSVRWVDSASARVGLTGVTTGLQLTNTYENINNQGSRVTIKGGGIMNVILVIEGIKLYSYPISCTIDYSVY